MFIRTIHGTKDQSLWDNYVLSHPDASPYHLSAWKNSVEQAYGHRAFYFLAEEDTKITGVLPLFNLRLPLLLNELTALPFCDIGNCLANSFHAQDMLLHQLKDLARHLKCTKISLRGALMQSELSDSLFILEKINKVRMLLPLPNSSDTLWSNFKSKLRSQIRKAEKNGVRFRWAGIDGVESFYTVYCKNMRDLGSPPHSRKWFEAVMTNYGKRARIGLAEYEGTCVGAGLILSTDTMTSIPWASTLRDYNRLSPNMLLYWNFLKFSADSGLSIFDFGRSTEGEGTYRFKKQWGAQPLPLHWYSLCNTSRQHDKTPETLSGTRGMVAQAWSKLPLSVSNVLGPCLRRYISL